MITAILMSSTMNSRLFYLTLLIYLIVLIGWLFLVGKFYNRINKKHKIENYKENFWFALWLFSLFIIGIEMFYIELNINFNPIIKILASSVSFFSMIMTANFSAKAYSQYESKKELKFGNYFWNFVLILYFIIGVWIIQPKINKEIGIRKKL